VAPYTASALAAGVAVAALGVGASSAKTASAASSRPAGKIQVLEVKEERPAWQP
jgi:hypothetical protein